MSSGSIESEVQRLLDRLDGSGSDDEWGAALELRDVLGDRLPERLLDRYRESKKWSARSSCVYHSVRYAKSSEAAVQLGLLALNDRAKAVRYRACMLLACSQRKEILPTLRRLLPSLAEDTKPDLLAAIDAVESQNQNYFVDRDHSGLTTLVIS